MFLSCVAIWLQRASLQPLQLKKGNVYISQNQYVRRCSQYTLLIIFNARMVSFFPPHYFVSLGLWLVVSCPSLGDMPRIAEDELTESRVAALMEQAQAAVDAGWAPREHLPPNIFKFLEPLTIASGQGFYATTMMILGALPALCNGAKIQLWPGRPTPLMAIVLQVAAAQKGKSRLTALVEEASSQLSHQLPQKVVQSNDSLYVSLSYIPPAHTLCSKRSS